jgi:hypothetical protein
VPVGDDRFRRVEDDPGVGGEVEIGVAPLGSKEVLVQHDLAGVVEIVGDQYLGHVIEIVRGQRPKLVSGGEAHAAVRVR